MMIFHKNSKFKMHTLLGYLWGLNFNNKNNFTHHLNKQSASMYIPGCSLNITEYHSVISKSVHDKSHLIKKIAPSQGIGWILVDHPIFVTISFQSASV